MSFATTGDANVRYRVKSESLRVFVSQLGPVTWSTPESSECEGSLDRTQTCLKTLSSVILSGSNVAKQFDKRRRRPCQSLIYFCIFSPPSLPPCDNFEEREPWTDLHIFFPAIIFACAGDVVRF